MALHQADDLCESSTYTHCGLGTEAKRAQELTANAFQPPEFISLSRLIPGYCLRTGAITRWHPCRLFDPRNNAFNELLEWQPKSSTVRKIQANRQSQADRLIPVRPGFRQITRQAKRRASMANNKTKLSGILTGLALDHCANLRQTSHGRR
jgi:hypothetical protein